MARVNIAAEFDIEDERHLSNILDEIVVVIRDRTGEEPMMGLQVDGDHRDPDEPESDLFG